jgi:cell division protein FtsQ
MSAVAATTDRRFRRSRVKPARGRRLRRIVATSAKALLIAVVALYGAYQGGSAVLHADLLRIDRILVHGNRRLSGGEVLAVLTGLRGENILLSDLATWRQRLLASPWVRDAALRRSLPSTVEVFLSEREPIAIGRIKADLYLVDERGGVIADYGPQYADLDLPIIDGFDGLATGADAARAELAARLIGSLRAQPDIARRLSQVDVRNVRNASVILTDDSAVIHVGDDKFLTRLQSYLELSSALRERVPAIEYVDLRFDDRIYVRPVAGRRSQVARLGESGVGSR